jgi:hypothetical protein
VSRTLTRRTGTYDVTLEAYCGMSVPLGEGLDRDAVKGVVRSFLRRARRAGSPVTKIGKGRWEIETREDAVAVGDHEGVLIVRPRLERYRVILGRKIRLN